MAVLDLPDGDQPASVLVLAPGFGDAGAAGCAGLFADSGADELLYVTWSGDPSDRLAHVRDHADVETARAVVVGDLTAPPSGPFDAVETVNAPTDLTGVGIAVTELLAETDGRTAVCFDSVTALLQYVDVDTAYEFLHVFAGRLHRNDARGHFHMDPGAHDDQVVAQMASLADGRLALTEEGTVAAAAASLRDWNR